MNWKSRQMFGGRPSGIVQMMGGGMTPYPTHVMPDGTVMPGAVHGQGYEAGGLTSPAEPSIEQRVAMIAAQQGIDVPTARAQLLQKTAADQGMQLPVETIKQYAVGLISLQDALAQGIPTMRTGAMEGPTESVQSTGPQMQAGSMGAMAMQQPNAQIQMQAGGVIPELFEEGDSDINNALNNLASVSNPEVPDMPASNGMALPSGDMVPEEMTMDQGPGDYSTAVRFLKRSFQDEIKEFVVQTPDQDEVQKYLAGVNRSYNQEVRKLKDQFNIDQSAPTEELLDDTFKQEIASMMNAESLPGMQGGGLVETIQTQADLIKWGIPYDIAYWQTLTKDKKKLILDRAQLERAYTGRTPAGKPLTRADLDTRSLDALMQERRENAERMGAAARAGYGSSSGNLSHYRDSKIAGEAAEAVAMDKIIADQIGDERGILGYLASANTPGRGTTGSGGLNPTAAYQDALLDVVVDDPYQKSLVKRYEDYLKAIRNDENTSETKETVQIVFSEQGETPPIKSFQGKKAPAPGLAKVTWIQFYNAEKAVMMKKAKEENEEFPERGTLEYHQKLAPIIYKWLDLAN